MHAMVEVAGMVTVLEVAVKSVPSEDGGKKWRQWRGVVIDSNGDYSKGIKLTHAEQHQQLLPIASAGVLSEATRSMVMSCVVSPTLSTQTVIVPSSSFTTGLSLVNLMLTAA